MLRISKICRRCGACVVLVGITAEMASAHTVECPNGCAKAPPHVATPHIEETKGIVVYKEPDGAAFTTSASAFSTGFIAFSPTVEETLLSFPRFGLVSEKTENAEQKEGPSDTGAS